MKCQNCGKNVYLPYKCKYCGGLFCDDCRLPPAHNCPNIREWARKEPPSYSRKVETRSYDSIPVKVSSNISYMRYKKKKKSRKKYGVIVGCLLLLLAVLFFAPSVKNELTFAEFTKNEEMLKGLKEVSKSVGEIKNTVEKAIKPPSKEEIRNETIHKVLAYLNKEREKRGLPPVKLMITGIAQFRADDMIRRGYFSHYDPNGYPPFYYYTKMGGLYAMEENCGEYRIVGGSLDARDVPNYAVKSVEDMIYNDALSNWGHRDSLLDPMNNYVDIGVSWNSNRMVIVIHMIKCYVCWRKQPSIRDGVFSASGILNSSDIKFYGVFIYYHPPPNKEFCKRNSYSLGDCVAGVLPEPYYCKDAATIRPIKWLVSDKSFDISFKIKPVKGKGFYTIVIYAKNIGNLKHPFDPKRDDKIPILEYSFLYR